MNSILIQLVFIASTLVLVQCKDISECDAISQNTAGLANDYWPTKASTIVEFINENCPTSDFLRHLGYVKLSLEEKGGAGGPDKHYRIDTEQREERTAWLAEAERKVSQYWSELADFIASGLKGEAIEYPSTSNIESLLNEVDEDDKYKEKRAFDYFSYTYWDLHIKDEGLKKMMDVLGKD